MSRNETVGSIGWVASRLLAQGLEFLAWVLLARRLGTSAVGVLAVAAIIGRLLGLIGDWGANFRGPRDVVLAGRESPLISAFVRRREQVSTALTVVMLIGVIALRRPEVLPICFVVLGRGCNRDWIALGEGRRLHATVPLLVQSIVICGGVALTTSSTAAAAAIGTGNAIGLLIGIRLNPVRSGAALERVAVDGWYLMAGIADQVLVSADTVILLWLRSASEAGVYTSIYRLPLAWITVIGLVTTAIIPVVARAVAERRIDRATLHRRADAAAISGALVVLPAAILGLVLVGPIFGEDFVVGRDALLILFVATAATTASAPYRVLYTTFGSDRRVGLVTAVVACGNLIGNVVVVGRWGMQGAAMTTLVSQVAMLGFFATWSMTNRRAAGPGQRFSSIAASTESA